MSLPDRDTLLGWLAERAENRGSKRDTAAIKLLLEELKRDGADDEEAPAGFDALDPPDELQARRDGKAA